MTPNQKIGYDLACGALMCIGKYFTIGIVILIALSFFRKFMGLGMDDSDKSKWDRSGLTIYTDAKTGVQYLSDGNGGMVQRAEGAAR